MKKGLADCWSQNWPYVLAGGVLAVAGFIVANILTGGAILAAAIAGLDVAVIADLAYLELAVATGLDAFAVGTAAVTRDLIAIVAGFVNVANPITANLGRRAIPDRLSPLGGIGSTSAGRRKNLPTAELVEDGRLAAPVRVFASMDDDGGEMLPRCVGFRAVELERLGDAERARGEHASNEAMMEWRLTKMRAVPASSTRASEEIRWGSRPAVSRC